MDYEKLSIETKTFVNKAMDVYSTIFDIKIEHIVKADGSLKKHIFTKTDKKILSLFIAGFIVDGKLKDILEDYDDLKLQDLLTFVEINENDINELADNQYSDFYSKCFRLDIKNIIDAKHLFNNINIITPEVIVWCLGSVQVNGSSILNYFSRKYGIHLFFSDHNLFKELKNYNLKEGNISKKVVSENNSRSISSSSNSNLSQTTKEQTNKALASTTSYDDSIWSVLDEIQKKFIGQEQVAEYLFYNIINNQQLADMSELPDGQRSIIFLDGPTGTGKTAITREITKKLGIPFSFTALTNYSATGYKGGDITDTLVKLVRAANGDVEKAERGIVVLDEFDKISVSGENALEMKKAVQQQLLDFMGGGSYSISVGDTYYDKETIEFDTSRLSFVCLGALTDLRFQKTKKNNTVGFGVNKNQDEKNDYIVTPQDLIGIGLEKELVGRLNTYLHTKEYSREDFIRILKESTISPLIGFRLWIETKGKKLKVDDEVYGLIADQAYELNTGARGLQTAMNNIRTHFLKEVIRGTNHTIYLDAETVEKINEQTIARKGRP